MLAFASDDNAILGDYKGSTIEGFFLGASPSKSVIPTQQGRRVIVSQIID